MKPTRTLLFDSFNYVVLTALALLMIFPFWNVFATSLSTPYMVSEGELLFWPKQFTWVAYDTVFHNFHFMRTLMNTVIVTIVGTIVSMLGTTMLAYPLSKRALHGSGWMLFLVFFTMLFSGGIIPSYILVKQLGLMNTFGALIVPNAISAFNVILMISFFRSIPDGLEESGKMDGCNDIGVFLRIVIPISMPILATMTLFYAVGRWNMFFQAVMYVSDGAKMTLQVLMRQILMQLSNEALDQSLASDVPSIGITVRMAMIVISTLPILMVYPFLQKYFAKGVLLGSLKG